jgi:hypothetical protein
MGECCRVGPDRSKLLDKVGKGEVRNVRIDRRVRARWYTRLSSIDCSSLR